MSATAFPSSTVGLSANLDYKLPPSMSESSRSYTASIAPDGITSVASPAATALFLANSGVVIPFNSQTLAFTIPSGNSNSLFLDPKETFLTFRVSSVSSAAGVVAGGVAQFISSGSSWFDQLILYSNNIPIEQINSYNILSNMLLNATVNQSERAGGVAVGMGCDSNSQTGVDIQFTAATTTYYTFSIPLLSVIGLNSADKLFPIGAVGNLQLQMVTASVAPVASFCTGTTTIPNISFTLDNFALNLKYIDIGEESARILLGSLADGKYFLKAQSWTQASSVVPAGTQGNNNILYQIRNSSLKSVLFQQSQAMTAATLNGYYDAINYGITNFNVSIGGMSYPQRPYDVCRRPSEAYMGFMSALGYQGNYKAIGGTVGRSSFGSTLPNITGISNPDSMLVVPAAGVRAESAVDATTVNVARFPSMHYLGVDLEKSSGVLFQGVNTRQSPPVGNWFFGNTTTGLANAVTSYCFGLFDCVLVIDPAQKTIQAFV